MTLRSQFLETYFQGWEELDADKVLSSLADDFNYIDPSMPAPIAKDMMRDYMRQWSERTAALGGTGELSLAHTVTQEQGECLLSWTWWRFEGTEVQGAALIKVSDRGVLFEKIAFYRAP
jgi:ketosteroid isomerase-like protein